ncbi:MAG: UbiH/UbiF/VisC/COQ6 family ubiquinone biosynthesis hydroxylase [Rhizobiales bacterium]|nr:UbiH/UbiF/VisC/COQ6 family ubiquinone biosynthesis hydroxylase [Hyphomicrobiales bacterium]
MTETPSSAPASSRHDVIIVGGGPNGLAMALALAGPQAQPRARVLVVDSRDPRGFAAAGVDTRGSALTRATQNVFKALGVWPALAPHCAEMSHIVVTDGKGSLDTRPALLSFLSEGQGKAAACITENRWIASALMGVIDTVPEIEIRGGATITAISRSPGFAEVHFADGASARAPLLIGADGRNSFVRNDLGIEVDGHDDQQVALTFSMAHELPHGNRAEEHFSATGVFALLPLPGNRASIVWGTSPAEAQRLMALDDRAFEDALNEKVGSHLGRITLEDRRQAYPLKRHVARAITGPRTALIGDAAHIIHPLAGLGLNLGFKDVAALADCVSEAMLRGEDHGGPAVMERYAQWRRFDIVSTIVAMEGMNALFVNDWPLLALLRQTGLRLVDKMPAVKKALMEEAAGMTGTLPKLMRGM